jgi:hypothetical protein
MYESDAEIVQRMSSTGEIVNHAKFLKMMLNEVQHQKKIGWMDGWMEGGRDRERNTKTYRGRERERHTHTHIERDTETQENKKPLKRVDRTC